MLPDWVNASLSRLRMASVKILSLTRLMTKSGDINCYKYLQLARIRLTSDLIFTTMTDVFL